MSDLLKTGKNSDYVIAYVSCPEAQAATLAQRFVAEKAAACVNIMPNVRSIYGWQDKIEDENESILMIKTKTSALDKLAELVKRHHPYELPELITTPITAGLTDYLSWIDATTQTKTPDN